MESERQKLFQNENPKHVILNNIEGPELLKSKMKSALDKLKRCKTGF